MSKIKRISVYNFKAISSLTSDFNGCTAIITGGNNKGKSTFLRGLADRIRGLKPELPLKSGEHEGFSEITLTTGERLRWQFDDKTKAGEKLIFITEKEVKAPLTRAIADRLFPATFDVDKFIVSTPQAQRKMLQELVGLDFTDVDARYKTAYDERTAANRAYNEAKVKFEALPVPEKINTIDVKLLIEQKEKIRYELNQLYLANKKSNDEARKKWQDECEQERRSVSEHNKKRAALIAKFKRCYEAYEVLREEGFKSVECTNFIMSIEKEVPLEREYTPLPEPAYITELPDNAPLLDIEAQINSANETNRKAQLYNDWLKAQERKDESASAATEADASVQAIEAERMKIIKSASMPEGFSFSDDGIMYNGLPFTREQLSSSGIYIAALKLAAMTLGEVKTLHFDASFLDKNSLAEIEKWAESNDLQLLIERPDWEGGEITYELIQK